MWSDKVDLAELSDLYALVVVLQNDVVVVDPADAWLSLL